jgi:hypothetical protein
MLWVSLLSVIHYANELVLILLNLGKVGMSVLVKGLAMDFVRQGRNEMAVTSIWPASVCILILDCLDYVRDIADCVYLSSLLSRQLRSITRQLINPTRRI